MLILCINSKRTARMGLSQNAAKVPRRYVREPTAPRFALNAVEVESQRHTITFDSSRVAVTQINGAKKNLGESPRIILYQVGQDRGPMKG
jgi:hypothetical protein